MSDFAPTLPTGNRSRARNWFFTLNNPEFALDTLFESLFESEQISYAGWQLEIGERTNVVHYQGIFK